MADDITARCPGCGVEFNASDLAKRDECPVCGVVIDTGQSHKSPKTVLVLLVIVGIVVLVLFFVQVYSPRQPTTQAAPSRTLAEELTTLRQKNKERAISQISIVALWDKKEHPYALVLDLTIANESETPIKDPVISCIVTAPSGTAVDVKKHTIYRTIPANRMVQLSANFGPVNPQGDWANCRCVDATSAE